MRGALPNPLPIRCPGGVTDSSRYEKTPSCGAFSSAGGGTRTPDTRIMITAQAWWLESRKLRFAGTSSSELLSVLMSSGHIRDTFRRSSGVRFRRVLTL